MSLPYADWLTRQRWYAGRGRTIATAEPAKVTPLGDDLDHVMLRVTYADGTQEQYQVFVGWDRPLPDEYASIAVIGADEGRLACDALYDETSAQSILALIGADETRGGIELLAEPDAGIDASAPPHVSDAEQSNTSVIFGSSSILKVYRRVVPGQNPDVELGRVLARFGSAHVAALLGAIETRDGDGSPVTLAALNAFAPNSGDGWAMASASARDLLADPGLRPEEAGGDFAGEAARLGEGVAEVHSILAKALGTVTAVPPVDRWMARLDDAITHVPELASRADEVRAAFAAAAAPATMQRVHGDLHLGQVLRASENWLLIDFEGEPGHPMAERRAPDSPIRDIAGMLRSFDYASQQMLVDRPDDEELAAHAAEWAEHNRDAFCTGYAAAAGFDPRDSAALLRAYEVDKLVYEAAYETRYRPAWARIPMRAFDRLFAATGR